MVKMLLPAIFIRLLSCHWLFVKDTFALDGLLGMEIKWEVFSLLLINCFLVIVSFSFPCNL